MFETLGILDRVEALLGDPSLEDLWQLLRRNSDDPLVQQDLSRIAQVLDKRTGYTWLQHALPGDE